MVHLSDYRGKVVLLDFWATWCGPCRIEIPWFMDLERKNKDQGFEVLGVSMDDEGWEVVKPFLAELGVNYRVVMGNDSTAQAYGGVDALPTTFLIDREARSPRSTWDSRAGGISKMVSNNSCRPPRRLLPAALLCLPFLWAQSSGHLTVGDAQGGRQTQRHRGSEDSGFGGAGLSRQQQHARRRISRSR